LEALEETLALLSDPEALRELEQADRDLQAGEGVHGVEAVRALRRR